MWLLFEELTQYKILVKKQGWGRPQILEKFCKTCNQLFLFSSGAFGNHAIHTKLQKLKFSIKNYNFILLYTAIGPYQVQGSSKCSMVNGMCCDRDIVCAFWRKVSNCNVLNETMLGKERGSTAPVGTQGGESHLSPLMAFIGINSLVPRGGHCQHTDSFS